MALESAATYPIYYAVSEDNRIANWRPLAHIFMAIPHFIIGRALDAVAQACVFISWFVILFTGRMPEGLVGIIMMAERYGQRVTAFTLGLTEQYPPFEFQTTAGDPGTYAIRYDVRPEYDNRNRLTVAFRIFMLIPIAVFTALVAFGAFFVMIAAWFAVLFTGTYPVGMRNFVIKVLRLSARVTGYGYLLTDEYPPFALQ